MSKTVLIHGNTNSFRLQCRYDKLWHEGSYLYGSNSEYGTQNYYRPRVLIDSSKKNYRPDIEAIWDSYNDLEDGYIRTYKINPDPPNVKFVILTGPDFKKAYGSFMARKRKWKKKLYDTCFIQIGETYEDLYGNEVIDGLGKGKIGIDLKPNYVLITGDGTITEEDENTLEELKTFVLKREGNRFFKR